MLIDNLASSALELHGEGKLHPHLGRDLVAVLAESARSIADAYDDMASDAKIRTASERIRPIAELSVADDCTVSDIKEVLGDMISRAGSALTALQATDEFATDADMAKEWISDHLDDTEMPIGHSLKMHTASAVIGYDIDAAYERSLANSKRRFADTASGPQMSKRRPAKPSTPTQMPTRA